MAYVDVVPLTGALNSRLLNPNALSSSQVNQLISQRPEQDKLKYGNSELAFLLNSPTIRERQTEKRKSPVKSTAARRITLEESADCESQPSTEPAESGTPTEQVAENRPVVEHIRQLLSKKMQENEAEQAAQAELMEKEPVTAAPKEGRRKSVNVTREVEEMVIESDEDDGVDEMESIALALSKPTKSGRMPKLVERRSTFEESDTKPKVGFHLTALFVVQIFTTFCIFQKPRTAPLRLPPRKRFSVGRRKSKEPESQEECVEEPEADDEQQPHTDMKSLLNNVEPGSLVVIKSTVPNEPGREIVQVKIKIFQLGIC